MAGIDLELLLNERDGSIVEGFCWASSAASAPARSQGRGVVNLARSPELSEYSRAPRHRDRYESIGRCYP